MRKKSVLTQSSRINAKYKRCYLKVALNSYFNDANLFTGQLTTIISADIDRKA